MITSSRTIVCPIDFSETSRAALGYAVALAEYLGARLTAITVDDPLLSAAATTLNLMPSYSAQTETELRRFCAEASDGKTMDLRMEYRVASGRPAAEIIRVAGNDQADLIVMGSHGRSGSRTRFLGSTVERVLRDTSIPVLVSSDTGRIHAPLPAMATRVRSVIAPVDFSASSHRQSKIAARIALGLDVPLVLTHVLEPIFVSGSVRFTSGADVTRHGDARTRLERLRTSLPASVDAGTLVLDGDAAQQIVSLAESRDDSLIVIGLHSSGLFGPRLGSITYRVLCRTNAMVLAVPPIAASAPARRSGRWEQTSAGVSTSWPAP